ncbi:zinc finger protein 830-like isoform X2 [Orbicella faveolata]|uniref:zinc finger protein 830-like isoform X2 n=1 Tax=Orbicella faveolata TaxID=48498 RepID=UPI0009E283DB|nr:zinc finger protein 830-like isoform X2 [Orbicella faveolata]
MASRKVDARLRLVKNQREMKKKIESPLAKYNSSGQLFCVLCNIPIKSAILWTSHVLGKKHKENLANFKGKSSKDQSVTEVEPNTDISQKKIKDVTGPQDLLKMNKCTSGSQDSIL